MIEIVLALVFVAVLVAHFTYVIVDGKRAEVKFELEEEIRQMKKKARGE